MERFEHFLMVCLLHSTILGKGLIRVLKKFPFWQKRDIGVFTYIWTAQSLT